MTAWTVTGADELKLRGDSAPSESAAWGQAAAAALAELALHQGAAGDCMVTVGPALAMVVAGRTAGDEFDMPATRAAVEQLVLAAVGQQILDKLLGS